MYYYVTYLYPTLPPCCSCTVSYLVNYSTEQPHSSHATRAPNLFFAVHTLIRNLGELRSYKANHTVLATDTALSLRQHGGVLFVLSFYRRSKEVNVSSKNECIRDWCLIT